MLQDILDIEGLKQDAYRISQEMTEGQCTLTAMAAKGAVMTTDGVYEARENFTRLQCDQWIRSLQLDDIGGGGDIEGSLQRAALKVVAYCEQQGA